MNETLEAMARALFKSWFVDFDPVRAKAEGRDPGLPQPLADLFPDSFEDSELGEIPRGWEVGPILEHARLTERWHAEDRPTRVSERTDRLGERQGRVAVDTDPFSSTPSGRSLQRGLDESATQMIPAFCSVVVARGATTGRMVLFGQRHGDEPDVLRARDDQQTPFALYCRLRVEIDALVHAAHGSVFDTITTSTFASSRIVLPAQPLH